jgi:hypothetical protein
MGDVNVETLKNRWAKAMACADKSACRLPEAYKQLKCLVYRINHETIDVGDYFRLAKRLTRLLETIGEDNRGAVFDYFVTNMDPNKKGSARHFRYMCEELGCFILKIDQFRRSMRSLKIVK